MTTIHSSTESEQENEVTPSQSVSMVSGTPSSTRKRRRLTSNSKSTWTHEHFKEVGQEKHCKYCAKVYGPNTSTGTMGRHLVSKHDKKEVVNDDSVLIQTRVNSVSAGYHKKIDSAIARFIVSGRLGHAFAESDTMKDFVSAVNPGLKVKKARTVKRRLFCMYMVLKKEIQQYYKFIVVYFLQLM